MSSGGNEDPDRSGLLWCPGDQTCLPHAHDSIVHRRRGEAEVRAELVFGGGLPVELLVEMHERRELALARCHGSRHVDGGSA